MIDIRACIPETRTIVISVVRLCIGGAFLFVASHIPAPMAAKAAAFIGHAFLFLGALTPLAHVEGAIVGGLVDKVIDAVRVEQHTHTFGPYYEAARDDVVVRCGSCGVERT